MLGGKTRAVSGSRSGGEIRAAGRREREGEMESQGNSRANYCTREFGSETKNLDQLLGPPMRANCVPWMQVLSAF